MYAVIDLETTGGRADQDRITEIAVIIHDGSRVVDEFCTLVNPERPIPAFITDITGINDRMVSAAPKFYEVARQIVEITEGCIFVAHNVNFDYGFLREEFKRLAYNFERDKLCTVRLSRVLLPGLPSYSLGALCQRLGIPNHARHRAKGDADATVLLLELLLQRQPTLGKVQRSPRDPYTGIPEGISRGSLSRLPEDAGVYFFHDADGKALHVNASKNIRQAALKELLMLGKSALKAAPQFYGLADVTWELTGNELIALLRVQEEQLLLGIGNTTSGNKSSKKFAAHVYQDQRGYARVFVDKSQKGKVGFGEFATELDAKSAIEARLRRHQLCAVLGGLEVGSGPCSWHDHGNTPCKGACCGKESPEAYNQRLSAALQGLGLPYPTFFLLGEGRNQNEVSVVGLEQGEVLGFAFFDASQGWEDADQIKSLLRPLKCPEPAKGVVKHYLSQNRLTKLVPF